MPTISVVAARPVSSRRHGILAATIALLLTAQFSTQLLAMELSTKEINGSLDTTLSYGAAIRLEGPDQAIIGIANGGTAYGVNADDGNLNYAKETFISNAVKLTTELDLDYRNIGLFLRGSAFYDFENMGNSRTKAALTGEAEDLVGTDVRLLDAYVTSRFDINDKALDVRIGQQLLSWGESTFIQNSINTINPADVSKLRVPGAELREALLPVSILSTSMDVTANNTVEAFYQLAWEETIIDPPGSYFSSNDFVGDGGSRVLLGFGAVPDTIDSSTVVSAPANTAVVSRSTTRTPDNGGQYGLAWRLFLPNLNETELGFYYMNTHSRVPLIGATTGTAAAAAGVDPDGLSYVQTARFFTSYPEDIKLFGASFNSMINASGTAIQGEVSYRQDVPLQIDDIEILFAALGAQDNLAPGTTAAYPLALYGQLGLIPFETDIMGYIRRDVSQAQVTLTHFFGPGLGADGAVLIGEAGINHTFNMPDKDQLRLNGPGTFISGNQALSAFHSNVFEGADRFADASSWGYRMAGRLEYNNVIGAINLLPRFAWSQDVNGISPGPGGSFIEGRRALTIGLGATYQNSWSADASYTRFDGAGRYNLINDRDFIAGNIKYSF